MTLPGESLQNATVNIDSNARLVVNFTDCESGAPVDVTGALLAYTVRANSLAAAILTRITPSEIVIADDGLSAVITLAPTGVITPGVYFHKLMLTNIAGSIMAVLTGSVNLSADLITSCAALTAAIDLDLFGPASPATMLDFSYASNAINLRLFLMR